MNQNFYKNMQEISVIIFHSFISPVNQKTRILWPLAAVMINAGSVTIEG